MMDFSRVKVDERFEDLSERETALISTAVELAVEQVFRRLPAVLMYQMKYYRKASSVLEEFMKNREDLKGKESEVIAKLQQLEKQNPTKEFSELLEMI